MEAQKTRKKIIILIHSYFPFQLNSIIWKLNIRLLNRAEGNNVSREMKVRLRRRSIAVPLIENTNANAYKIITIVQFLLRLEQVSLLHCVSSGPEALSLYSIDV